MQKKHRNRHSRHSIDFKNTPSEKTLLEISQTIYGLAMFYAESDTEIQASDLEGTRFEESDPAKVPHSELVAELLLKALRLDPENIDAMRQLAFVISHGVHIRPADLKVISFDEALCANPSELEAALYRRILIINPNCEEAYYYLGILFEEGNIEIPAQDLLQNTDRITLASEYYKKVIGFNGRFKGSAYRHLAFCLYKKMPTSEKASIKEDMAALFRQAIAINPQDSVSLYHLAGSILDGVQIKDVDFSVCDNKPDRKIDLVAALYRKAITYNPKYYLAMRRLDECLKFGTAIQEQEDTKLLEPYRCISTAQRLVERADVLYGHKEVPILEKDWAIAELEPSTTREVLVETLYRKAHFLDPTSIQAMLGLARCIEVSDSKTAADLYRKVISIEPRNSSAFYRLAVCIGQYNVEIKTSDLLGTAFAGCLPESVDRNQLAVALLAKAAALDPSDKTLAKELEACGYPLAPNKSYCPQLRAKLSYTDPVVIHTNNTMQPAKLR